MIEKPHARAAGSRRLDRVFRKMGARGQNSLQGPSYRSRTCRLRTRTGTERQDVYFTGHARVDRANGRPRRMDRAQRSLALHPRLDYREFKRIFSGKKGGIKPGLMNQKLVAGIGKSFEGIHPSQQAKGSRMPPVRLRTRNSLAHRKDLLFLPSLSEERPGAER